MSSTSSVSDSTLFDMEMNKLRRKVRAWEETLTMPVVAIRQRATLHPDQGWGIRTHDGSAHLVPPRNPRYFACWDRDEVAAAAKEVSQQALDYSSRRVWDQGSGEELVECLGGSIVTAEPGHHWVEKRENRFKVGLPLEERSQLLACACAIGALVLFLGFPGERSNMADDRYDFLDSSLAWRQVSDTYAAVYFAEELVRNLGAHNAA